mmetsp:Transcript_60993/g.98608  ORF Transcript_60993/g.98608 Transcript_60993/m.98608 type:complete len:94 (-) Transcript_60993:166-447(-)
MPNSGALNLCMHLLLWLYNLFYFLLLHYYYGWHIGPLGLGFEHTRRYDWSPTMFGAICQLHRVPRRHEMGTLQRGSFADTHACKVAASTLFPS